jgi:hypothetical protein
MCRQSRQQQVLIVDVTVQVRGGAGMGTATAIMVVCEDNARCGGRGGHDSPAGVTAAFGDVMAQVADCFPRRDPRLLAGRGCRRCRWSWSAQLLVAGRGTGAWRAAPPNPWVSTNPWP